MELKEEIIRELIMHGSGVSGITDPSTSALLRKEGVAPVTATIEKLSLAGIINHVSPLFGKGGGMWIGYQLTAKGNLCATNSDAFKELLDSFTEKPVNEVTGSITSLKDGLENKMNDSKHKKDYLNPLREIGICFQYECYTACISLCGKILEITLRETLQKNGGTLPTNPMIGNLIKAIRELPNPPYMDPGLNNISKIISYSRNTNIHAGENIPIPSRDQAVMVIFAMREMVNRHFNN